MYYRAEYHPYKTKDMKEAPKIFKKWLKIIKPKLFLYFNKFRKNI